LATHLETLGAWSAEQQSELEGEARHAVRAAAKEAESYGTLLDGHVAGRRSLFEDVFEEIPPHLQRQRTEMESAAMDGTEMESTA
jgi:2-oxoisovalerate dehydrogenase E1 component alpha subunit